MWPLIDADQNPATCWEGNDFIVNRIVDADGESWLEKNEGGWNWKESWNWKKVARVSFQVKNQGIRLAIPPRAALGLPKSSARVTLDRASVISSWSVEV